MARDDAPLGDFLTVKQSCCDAVGGTSGGNGGGKGEEEGGNGGREAGRRFEGGGKEERGFKRIEERGQCERARGKAMLSEGRRK